MQDLAVACCIHDNATSLFDRSPTSKDDPQEIANCALHTRNGSINSFPAIVGIFQLSVFSLLRSLHTESKIFILNPNRM